MCWLFPSVGGHRGCTSSIVHVSSLDILSPRSGMPNLEEVKWLSRSPSHIFLYCVQLLTYLILAAGAISTVVVYLAYKGDASITWSQTCGSFGGFCRKATASIAITFVVTLCYAVLSLISSYRLFSKYDAPVACDNKGIEIPVFHT